MRKGEFCRKFRFASRLPSRGAYVVLDGGVGNPLCKICEAAAIPYYNLRESDITFYLSLRFFLGVLKFTIKYGTSVGRLLAYLTAFEVRGVITLEKSDQRNALYAVSHALPNVQIISVQHSRFFESPHLHNVWGNPSNVRMITWGEYHADLAEAQGRDRCLMIPMGSINSGIDKNYPISKSRPIPILVALKAKGFEIHELSPIWSEKAVRAQSSIKLLEFLGEFANSRGLTLAFPHDKREDPSVAADYLSKFKSFSGAPCVYVSPADVYPSGEYERETSVYSTIASARLLIGVNSSLLWEAVADSQPVLAVSFDEVIYNQFPGDGPWVLHNPTREEFENAVEITMTLTPEELLQRSKQFSRYLVPSHVQVASRELCRFLKCCHKVATLDDAEELWRIETEGEEGAFA